MPTPTYVALAKTVLTGSQTTVTFSGISNAYTDLILLVSSRDSTSNKFGQFYVTTNTSSSTNQSVTRLYGATTSVASDRDSNTSAMNVGMTDAATATSNTFGSLELYFPNYTGSANKIISATTVTENNGTTGFEQFIHTSASLLNNTGAITSISLQSSTQFVSGSRFDLYGIKNS